ANSCTAVLSAVIGQPADLTATASSTNTTCGSANGTATVNPSGGTSPYSYLWSNAQTTQIATGLTAATYTVTVSDNHGCSFVISETVADIAGPVLALDSVHNENCFGDANGDIFISASGGTTPLNYVWSDASTNQDLINIIANAYTVTVTDANNCTATISGIITEPALLSAATSSTNSTCGNANGTASVNPSGGTSPYSYLWSNAQTAQSIAGLLSATYTVTITDSHGCSFVTTENVSDTPGPLLALDSIHDENCFGDNNGDIFISPSGGTAPLIYMWSNGSTDQDLINVIANSYTVTITDANNCTASIQGVITEPTVLNATTSSTNSTCGNANGTATATPSGGTNPYSYLWSDNQATQTATGLPAATYSVTVTDNHGCTTMNSVIVANTAGPAATVNTATDVTCYGFNDGSIDIATNGGTSPYSYLWSNGATTEDVANLPPGAYTITVTDFNSCVSSTGEFVFEPDSISISMNITPASGIPNGSIVITVMGGTPGYTYLWSTGNTTQNIFGLYPGIYSVTVTDNNLCTSNRSGTVTSSVVCNVAVDSAFNVRCYGETNGSIYITVTGAFAPVTYVWSNGATTEDVNNLVPGTYTV